MFKDRTNLTITLLYVITLTLLVVTIPMSIESKKVTRYDIYDVYKYSNDGMKLYVDYMYEKKYKVLNADDYDFDPLYMSMNNCQPVVRHLETTYYPLYFKVYETEDVRCGKDMISEISESNVPIYIHPVDTRYDSYSKSGKKMN